MSTSPEPGTPAPDPAASTPAPDPAASTPAPSPPAPEPAPTFAPPPMPAATLEQLAPGARALVAGLSWGAVMLVVLGFWMRDKAASMKMLANGLLIAGGVTAGMAVWQAFTLWFKQDLPDVKATTLGQQRKILGNILLLAGLVLIGLSFYLGIGKLPGDKTGFIRENMAESIGVLIFGVIALGAGYFLTVPVQTEDDSPMRSLAGKTGLLKMIQLLVGVVALGTFAYVAYTHRAANAYVGWIPELGALLFLSLLCISCVIWLNTGEFDEVGIRVFVLIFGGSVGCILFLYALARAYTWRQDIFLGGIPSWQGPNAYRFWLIVYLQLVALILMFVSFRLARTDIRSNVTLRRVMYGYDTLLQGLLLVEVLAVLNVVIYALIPFTYDWTKTRGAYALADSSRNLISGLKKEMNVVVLMRQGNPVYKEVHILLDNCQALNSTRFKVTYISPESKLQEFEHLIKVFPKISPEPGSLGSGVLIVNGPIPDEEGHKTTYAFVPDRKLHDMDRGRGRDDKSTLIFKGEAEILKEVKFLVQDKQKNKVYIVQGDEAPDLNSDDDRDRLDLRDSFANVGISALAKRLTLDNYEVAGLSFGKDLGLVKKPNVEVVYVKGEGPEKKKSVPEDCTTLIVAGVSGTMSEDALDAIERYMDRGGKMLVFLDVVVEADYGKMKNSGMEALLKRYGVEVSNDFALRFPIRGGDARDVLAFPNRKSDNPLAQGFTRPIVMRKSARVIRPGQPGKYRAEPILQLELAPGNLLYTVEKKTSVLSNPQKYVIGLLEDEAKFLNALSREPIPVAVAVSEPGGPKGDEAKPRMVVFGDTEFITNRDLERGAASYSFVTSSIEWMAGREEMMGTEPKRTTNFKLGPDVNYDRMVYLPGWIMLLSLIGLGIGVWIVRRR